MLRVFFLCIKPALQQVFFNAINKIGKIICLPQARFSLN